MHEAPPLLATNSSAAGSAFGIFSEEEEAAYQRFLLRHPEASAQAQALADVVGALHVNALVSTPSAETRRDLLTRIVETPQV